MDAVIRPYGTLNFLTQREISELSGPDEGPLKKLFHRCAFAVLNTGEETDSSLEVMERYREFEIRVIQETRGIKLELKNAPQSAFVDGKLMYSIRDHLFSVLRDIVYIVKEQESRRLGAESQSQDITDFIYHILRNAGALKGLSELNMAVCWGGHSINREEYEYTKEVGHQLGLRGFNICTGCGPGAMKGPMKGAAIGHAKQRNTGGCYLGLTEPGIIASESPNPIVNSLVVMPDIEKRLEAFLRVGHAFIIFPGGAGTVEELLYVLGILIHPENKQLPFPLLLTGPASSEKYFKTLNHFLISTLGDDIQSLYEIIIDDPERVAQNATKAVRRVRKSRNQSGDAYHFNWMLHIDSDFQKPFLPNHQNMRELKLDPKMPVHEINANLRRIFSGIVAGNIKEEAIRQIEAEGPFEIEGDALMMKNLDLLLDSFCKDQRMKLPTEKEYLPCYRILP